MLQNECIRNSFKCIPLNEVFRRYTAEKLSLGDKLSRTYCIFNIPVSVAVASLFPPLLQVCLCIASVIFSCSFTQSLPRFVLLLIRFCLPPPPRPLCWPPLAKCHPLSHKWSPLWFQTHKTSSDRCASYRTHDLHRGVMTVYLSPWREGTQRAASLFLAFVLEGALNSPFHSPSTFTIAHKMWEAHISPLGQLCSRAERS